MSWIIVGTAALGAVTGKMKNDAAKNAEASDRKLASETQRYSPWTKLQAGPIRRAGSAFGDMFGGAMSGAAMGQGLSSGWTGLGGGDSSTGAQIMSGTDQKFLKKKPVFGFDDLETTMVG